VAFVLLLKWLLQWLLHMLLQMCLLCGCMWLLWAASPAWLCMVAVEAFVGLLQWLL
jgi:hypothetical protein